MILGSRYSQTRNGTGTYAEMAFRCFRHLPANGGLVERRRLYQRSGIVLLESTPSIDEHRGEALIGSAGFLSGRGLAVAGRLGAPFTQ